MMKPSILAGAAALALLAAPSLAQTPASASASDLNLSLAYDGKLYVKILSVELEQQAGRGDFQTRMRVMAQGPLAVFKKLDVLASAQGAVERGSAKPETFNYVSKSGSKQRTLSADWTGRDVETNATPAFSNMGEPPATRSQRLESADPLTALMRMALADQPCSGSARIYDGKQRYNLNMSALGVGKLDEAQKAMGLEHPIRCLARHERVAGFKLNKTAAEKDAVSMRDMTISFARIGAEGPWVITSLSIDTGLGAAQLKLARMKVSGAGANFARLKADNPG
jgi:hypothetical protein